MSNANETTTEATLAILQAELSRLRDSLMEGWRSYHTWATWFLGIQAAGLGWIMVTALEIKNAPYMTVLASAAIVLNLLGIRGAFGVRSFTVLQMKRASAVCRTMMQHIEAAGLNIEITSGFPGELFRLGAGINVAAFSIAVAGWFSVLVFTMR